MAVSTDQYNRILARLTKIEETINDILVAMEHYVSMTQVNQLLTINKTELADLRSTVDSLEDRVEAIEEEPLT
jgi:tetrahydromethanopterin S-methyltransferase subunit G